MGDSWRQWRHWRIEMNLENPCEVVVRCYWRNLNGQSPVVGKLLIEPGMRSMPEREPTRASARVGQGLNSAGPAQLVGGTSISEGLDGGWEVLPLMKPAVSIAWEPSTLALAPISPWTV
jgi:hypothetical protein